MGAGLLWDRQWDTGNLLTLTAQADCLGTQWLTTTADRQHAIGLYPNCNLADCDSSHDLVAIGYCLHSALGGMP